ncbi:MAG: glycosyltransferase family 2 protein [Victivallales bacterium]
MKIEKMLTDEKPPVSVVIVNYNAGACLADCIGSALPQADEILVVDNASTDGSIEECLRRFAGLRKLMVIRNPVNSGFAAACNIGFRRATGDFVLFLNPDCRLDKAAVAELLRVLQSDKQAGMAGGFLANPDGTEQRGGRRAVPTPWLSLMRGFGLSRFAGRLERFSDFNLNVQPVPDLPVQVDAISGACMLVKRKAVEDVGLWDEGYFLHCEDLDWCMRFRQKGWKILFVPEALVFHALGVCSKSRPLFVERHKHRGMIRFYKKFFRHQYPGVLMWAVVLGVWLRFLAVVGLHAVKKFKDGKRDS